MSNRLEQLLTLWQAQKNSVDWVLATVIETQGSSYRKAGAMMLINSLGQYYGLLSGGCLESDIMRKARQCMSTGNNHVICYDMRSEDDISWQLGIGCGGMVKILLQPLLASNNWLDLDVLQGYLAQRQSCFYLQNIDQDQPRNQVSLTKPEIPQLSVKKVDSAGHYFLQELKPTPALAIFGGGLDALPLVDMAKNLGWQTILIDERVNYARPAYFKNADTIIRQPLAQLAEQPWLDKINAVVIMNHNVRLDAQALALVQASSASFVGLLGPTHRTEKVLHEANLSYQQLTKTLFNPVGLDIGGELPESIALSILSQAHAVLEGRNIASLSAQLSQVSSFS